MIYLLFLINLLLTVFIEGGLIFIIYRRKNFVYYSFLCNILTNPAINLLLWLIVWFVGRQFYTAGLIVLELAVLLVEAYIYKLLCGFKSLKALMLSFILNVASYGFGTIFYSLLSDNLAIL